MFASTSQFSTNYTYFMEHWTCWRTSCSRCQ